MASWTTNHSSLDDVMMFGFFSLPRSCVSSIPIKVRHADFFYNLGCLVSHRTHLAQLTEM